MKTLIEEMKDILENYVIQDMMLGIKSERTDKAVDLIKRYVNEIENG